MSYKLTVLVENTAPKDGELKAEHGLSVFVETPNTAFLFDCGQTGMAWRNAARLGIDLTRIEFVVLSHSHYDHAGGFPELLQYAKPTSVYVGHDFWQEKFSYDDVNGQYVYKGCGFQESDLRDWGISEHMCENTISLDDYASIFTNFDSQYSFERIPQKFRRGKEKESDLFDDEICLLLREKDGLALVVGCSHKGILNIVSTVKKRTGLPVHRIVGGIHLSKECHERIEMTIRELRLLGVKELNLCHCSGADVPGRIQTGTVIEISNICLL